jgi:hypothetical protein
MNNNNVPIKEAAKYMGKSQQFIRIGLQRKNLPFGVAEKLSTKYTYYISPVQFFAYIGKPIPKHYMEEQETQKEEQNNETT